MKNFLLIILKFFVIFFVITLIIFVTLLIFNLFHIFKLPFNEINYREFFNLLIIPIIFHAIYNSLFLSVFFFNILVLNNVRKLRILNFLIPLIISLLPVVGLNFVFKKDIKSLRITNLDDARIYFNEKSFIEYKEILKESFDENDFNKNIMEKISDEKTRLFIDKCFVKDFITGNYKIKKNLGLNKTERVLEILYSINYYNNVKYFFEGIKKNKIDNAVITNNGSSNFYKSLSVLFIEDRIFIKSPDKSLSLEFDRFSLLEDSFLDNYIIKTVINEVKGFVFNFYIFDNLIIKITLWLSFSFFTLSIISLIHFKSYPLISLILNSFILIMIYLFSSFFINYYNKLAFLFVENALIRGGIYCSILFILAIIFTLPNIFIFKSGIWEKE